MMEDRVAGLAGLAGLAGGMKDLFGKKERKWVGGYLVQRGGGGPSAG